MGARHALLPEVRLYLAGLNASPWTGLTKECDLCVRLVAVTALAHSFALASNRGGLTFDDVPAAIKFNLATALKQLLELSPPALHLRFGARESNL